MDRPLRLLLLAGTTEARALADALQRDPTIALTVSLAGRTTVPLPLAGTLRSGGFGGASGLQRWLVEDRTDLVIDATHPYAAQMETNICAACTALGLPLLGLERPAWERLPGDRWTEVASLAEAVDLIGSAPCCVLITTGRSGLEALESQPQHLYLIRSIEAPEPPLALPNAHYLSARGPFSYADELALMRDYGVEWLVSKNSGGAATYAKIEAARRLSLPVAMIARPHLARDCETAPDPEAALHWIAKWRRNCVGDAAHDAASSVERGV